jgi:hypothetical protein
MTNKNKTTPDIFANLIGGPDLYCIEQGDIFRHIHANGLKIKGLAHYLLYVDFILEECDGYINTPQLHSRETISKIMQLNGKHLSRYEPQWIADGWLLKHESSGGRYTSMRGLGHQFDHIRTILVNEALEIKEVHERLTLIRESTEVPFQKLRLLPKS